MLKKLQEYLLCGTSSTVTYEDLLVRIRKCVAVGHSSFFFSLQQLPLESLLAFKCPGI